MCTLSIHRADDWLVATMNRDEALARGPELPPQVHHAHGGLAWVAPRDSEKGGTWMGVNSAGVIACLLNAYRPGESLLPDTSGRYRSRGEIVPRLLEAGCGGAAMEILEREIDPEAYPSFTLLLVTPEQTYIYEWLRNGPPAAQTLAGAWILRSSAGWDSEDVARWREQRFAQWIADGERHIGALPAFHLLQEDGHLERSPLMRRDWSATRSITQAAVDLHTCRAELRYWPNPTSETHEPETRHALEISASAAPCGARTPQRA